MILQNMLAFVAEDKPKIVDSVVSKRQSDYRRTVIQPEADAVDFGRRQGFNDDEADARLR